MPLSGLVKGGLMSSVVRKINGPGSLVKGTFQTQPDTIQFKGWFGKFPHGRTQGWEEEAAREGGQFLILRPSEEGQPDALSGRSGGLSADGAGQGPTSATIAARTGEVKSQAAPAVRVTRIAGKTAQVPTGPDGYAAWSEERVRAEAARRELKGVDGKTPVGEIRKKLEAQDKRAEQGRKNLAKVRTRTFMDPFLNTVFPGGRVIKVPSAKARERARKDSNAPQVGGEWDGFDIDRFKGIGDKFVFVDSGWTDIDSLVHEVNMDYFNLRLEESWESESDMTPDAFWDRLESAA